MRQLVRLLLALILAGGAAGAAPAKGGELRQVFLVQNSGWMEPFYLDPSSPLKPFVKNLVGKSNLAGVDVVVASFNQDGQVAGRRSPEVLFQGPYAQGAVDGAINGISLQRKASGAYADADFRGALLGTFARILQGRQGIIWIVTNNKDAPDNNPAVIENTRAFYRALRESPHITAISAFPMRKLVTGPNFKEKGLIVYAIAYGERAAQALGAILRDGAPARALFPAPPVKLKPLSTDPVELQLNSADAEVRARVVQGRLIISGVPGGEQQQVQLQGNVKNTYYPQNIAQARMSAGWASKEPLLAGAGVTTTPALLRNVPAYGQSGPVSVNLTLPAVPRPPGLAGILEDERTVVGELQVRLDDLRFSLAPDFVSRIAAISGGETIQAEQAERLMAAQLPEVFLDYRRISSATMKVPVQVTFRYSPWPLILLIALAALLLGALLYLLFALSRPRAYTVRVGQTDLPVRIKPREQRTLQDAFGARALVTGRLFGPPAVRPIEQS
ncbi:MAG TPA: hypothetical protein VF631_10515 [Allosphingosinicella sp.]|jgi:hypothetical protein|uniref:hypothetical protein n=1 Tax=Allosphingosinicella sp. TaxID=2823234 RepID=UPI002F296724